MDKMNYPRGLIRYTTENALQGRAGRILRPRVFVYGALLLALVGGTLWSMTHRTPLRADLIRDRNALYRELPDGLIENVYTMKITNMDDSAHRYVLRVPGTGLARIELGRPLVLEAGAVGAFPVRIQLPASAGAGVQRLELELAAEGRPDIRRTVQARVLLPAATP
jgi:polyferredoxin